MSVLRLDVTLMVTDDANGLTLATSAYDWLTNPTRWDRAININRGNSARVEVSRVRLQRCYHDEVPSPPCDVLAETVKA